MGVIQLENVEVTKMTEICLPNRADAMWAPYS